MNSWVMAAAALAVVLSGAVCMVFFWPGSGARKKASAHHRNMRTTWKVVQLGGPILKGLGMAEKIKYGVVVSTDEMLAQTQTLLFCPLISGLDENGNMLAVLPWHVEVGIKTDPQRHAQIEYAHKYISTKIVLPISHNEIDTDGRERGYLDEASQALVAEKMSSWLPQFAKLAHKKAFGLDPAPHL